MKKKLIGFFATFIIISFVTVISFYFFVAFNYTSGFTYGTWINGVYCTNRTVEDVNQELVNKYEVKDITVSSSFFDDETVILSNIDFKIDYTDSLTKLQNNQNPYTWFKNLSSSYINSYISPYITFDDSKLEKEVSSLAIFDYYNPDNKYTVKIELTDEGYKLKDERRLRLDYHNLLEDFKKCVYNQEDIYIADFCFEDFYTDDKIKAEIILWNKVSDLIKPRFVLDMGSEVIPFDSALLSSFIAVKSDEKFDYNENGDLYYSSEYVSSYVRALLEPYNTYGMPRDYVSYSGDVKHIEKSLYGTEINVDKETEYITEAIINKKVETYIPKYIHKGYVRGLDDIGGEYIEVDLTNQKLLYVKDNNLLMNTDIVSGNPRVGSATPEMVCYINKKVRNAVLRGEDYVSPVDYWLAIYGNAIGLHDAPWQRKFGGNRYLTHGSHGCINMIYDDVAKLYEMVEVGVPVIVYK